MLSHQNKKASVPVLESLGMHITLDNFIVYGTLVFTVIAQLKATVEKMICRAERRIFLNEWKQNPTQLGTLAPVTVRFADALATLVPNPCNAKVVEIGAGTGRITRALLHAGVQPQNLVAVELNPQLCHFMRGCWQDTPNKSPIIIEGNALNLSNIIPANFVGTTTTVVCAIPFRYLQQEIRSHIIEAAGKVLTPGGTILHVTYHPGSPMPAMNGWSSHKRLALWWNLPPAFVFEFTPGSRT